MGKTTRFGVSLDSELLEKFDLLCAERSYANRSEAIRDLIRDALVAREWEDAEHEVAGSLTLVYDHHNSDLVQRLMDIQHDTNNLTLATLHLHLDHHNCLEVLALKGRGKKVRDLADKLISVKGVKHGRLSLTTTGHDLI